MFCLRIKKESIHIFVLLIFLMLGLFRICIFTNAVFKVYSFIILGTLCIYIGVNVRRMRRNVAAICLGAVAALSVVYQAPSLTGCFNAMVYFLEFTTPFLLMDYLFQNHGREATLKNLMLASILICSVMDFSVLIGMDIDKSHYQNLITYLLGNKFMVSYLHMQAVGFAGLFLECTKKRGKSSMSLALLLYGIYGIAVCAYVNCATGMIGNALILLLLYFPIAQSVKAMLAKPFTMLVILFSANILLIGFNIIEQLPIVQTFIVDILHKDLTLTGRYKIYAMLPNLIGKNLLLGYGYNSDIFADLIGYGNAQNGILQYAIDCGVTGVAAFILTWITSIKKVQHSLQNTWPLVCTVYGFIICSLVEVCFKFNFILILAVAAGLSVAADEA